MPFFLACLLGGNALFTGFIPMTYCWRRRVIWLCMPASHAQFMWQINRGLLLFNLIPAYPMDGGRILQELLWYVLGYPMSLKIAGMVGTVAGIGFVVLGFGNHTIEIPIVHYRLGGPDTMLIVIGILCAQPILRHLSTIQYDPRVAHKR